MQHWKKNLQLSHSFLYLTVFADANAQAKQDGGELTYNCRHTVNKLITETRTVFYAHTYRLCQFLIKNIPVINWGCTCVKTFAEDNFLREGWGCVNLMIFVWEFLCFGLTEKALFQVILSLLLVYADWEKGGVSWEKGGVSVTICLRVCMCVCFTT